MNRRLVLSLGIGLVAGGAALFLLLSRGEEVAAPPPVASRPPPAVPSVPVQAPTAVPAAPTWGPPPLVPAEPPASLRGTEPPYEALRVDAAGNLLLSPGLRSFFEYFLTAMGEEPLAVIRARILAALSARLPERAAAQGVELLDHYLAWRDATRGLAALPPGPNALPARVSALRRLRRQYLGEEATAALFGEDEAVESVTLERLALQADPSLSPEARERKNAELEELLPERVRAVREEALAPLRQQQEESALRDAGVSAEDLHRHRVATVGEEAAARLEALDRQRDEWRQRVEAYRAKRQALEQSPGLSGEERRRAEEELLSSSFTPQERLRVEALERIRAGSGPGLTR